MSDYKELATKNDTYAIATEFLTQEEIKEMGKDYKKLAPFDYAKKYRYLAFRPATLLDHEKNKVSEIKMNFCTNPFCKWHGQDQERFENVPNKPFRYRFHGPYYNKLLMCNEDKKNSIEGVTHNCTNMAVSNWSIAEEIKRLTLVNTVIDKVQGYAFHNEDCLNSGKDPFEHAKYFYKRGKSTSGSQKWQCKECKKFTNVLPDYKENHGYYQHKNDILPLMIELIINRVPIKNACRILKISPNTYYHKLEWIYRKCLEFLNRRETEALEGKNFDQLWINTDALIYNLNNIRRKGQGGLNYDDTEENKFPTSIIVSIDMNTRYVFRADVAYDFTISLEDIEKDTVLYHDDHLQGFCRKNQRLREGFHFAPQPPTPLDPQSPNQYLEMRGEFNRRYKYVDGVHVNATYTSIAHFWLLREMLKAKKWYFVTDNDSILINALMRAYVEEIQSKNAHAFTFTIDKTLKLTDAYKLSLHAKRNLYEWARDNNVEYSNLTDLAVKYLTEQLNFHDFYKYKDMNGKKYPYHANNPIDHPLPSADEGSKVVDCITNLSDRTPQELAKLIHKVNSHATDAFFNQVRRSISILERPLVTARGDNRAYIYANYNPKYAQYSITILRTIYNFCQEYKSSDGTTATPAQRLGIAERKYTFEDILYFR